MNAITDKAKKIKLLVLDVDGVLTDGKVYFPAEGDEIKVFHTHDGLGMKRCMLNGIEIAIISGRGSVVVRRRLKELNINNYYENCEDKNTALDELLTKLNLTDEQMAYVGDDLPDLIGIERAAIGIAVANAVDAVKTAADYITKINGGEGAVREVCELLLSAQNEAR